MKGAASFLTSRPPEEAMTKVVEIFLEEECVLRRVAGRLDITETSLHRWLRKNGYHDRLNQVRSDMLKRTVG